MAVRHNPPHTWFTLKGSAFGAERDDLNFGFNGMTDFAVCIFLLIFATVSKRVEDKVSTHIDLAQQTPQDYAICVKNPDPELRDADAYYEFFSKFGEVVFVSIALNNGELLHAMGRKREVELEMSATIEGQSLLSAGIDQDLSDTTKPLRCHHRILHALCISRRPQVLQERRRKLLEHIKQLSTKRTKVKRVYVIFNTEHAQRNCLHRMRTGLIHRFFNVQIPTTENDASEAIFQGRRLRVFEPAEPSEVHWENFHISMLRRLFRMCLSGSLTCGVLYISYLLLDAVKDTKGWSSGLIVSGVNVLLPVFMKLMTTHVEIHLDESGVQDSIMTKLVVARCFNTAIIKYLVTRYQEGFALQTFRSIMSILIADCFTTPLLNALNIVHRFQQWCMAPRAKTQQQMDVYFLGSHWNLAERYTDMIKTVFVGLFYSSVIPVLPFITSLSMVVIFWTDKYNILYQWRRPPAIDGTLAGRSRNFLSVSVCVHVIMARVFFANWPYADKSEKVKCGLFCLPNSYFTGDQYRLVHFYNLFGIATMGLVCWTYLYDIIFQGFGRFLGWVSEVGDATNIEYRSLVGTEAYVPLIRSSHFSDPLLACDVSDIPSTFLPIHEQRLTSSRQLRRMSLCSARDLPFISDPAERAKLFGSVNFYAPKADDSHFGTPVEIPSQILHPSHSATSDPLQYIPGMQGVMSIAEGFLQPGQLTEPIEPTPLVPLPPGWEEARDENGHEYYYNTESGQTQEERPVAGAGPGLPGQPGELSPYRRPIPIRTHAEIKPTRLGWSEC